MSTIIRGSGDTTFGGTIQSTGIDDNATSTAITIDASEKVGMGTASPTVRCHVLSGTSNSDVAIFSGSNATRGLKISTLQGGAVDEGVDFDAQGGTTGFQTFSVNGTERMRIDGSGSVLVGKISLNGNTVGFQVEPAGAIAVTRSGSTTAYFNRLSNDGDIVQFRKDGTTVGSIGSRSSGQGVTFNSQGADGVLQNAGSDSYGWNANYFYPRADNSKDVGFASLRFDDIYATNGTIQTSDRNEKQDIEELSIAETAVATACKGLLRKFRWQDSVAEKGDDARIHFGIIAQDLQDAFAAEGLDAGDYAMFISTTWYEKLVPVDAVIGVEAVEATYDDEGTELTPAVEAVEAKDAYTRTDIEDEPTAGYTERTRLGVRYPELLAFIISAI